MKHVIVLIIGLLCTGVSGIAFANGDAEVPLRKAALQALIELGHSGVPAELCRVLKEDPSAEVRAEAARLMAEHLANSPSAVVPCLQASLKEERQRLVMGESSVEVVVAADEEALRRLGVQVLPEGTVGIDDGTPSPMPGIGTTGSSDAPVQMPEIPSPGWHCYDRGGNEVSLDFSAVFRDVLKTLPEEVVDASWTRENGRGFTVTEGKEKRRYLTAKKFNADGDLLQSVELIYYVPTTWEGRVLASAGIRAAVYQYGYKKSEGGIGSVKEVRAKGEMIAGEVERKSVEQALGGIISEIGAVKDRAEFVHYLASGGDLLLTVAKLEGNNSQQYLDWTLYTRVINKELPPNGFIESVTEISDQQLKVRRKVQELANFAIMGKDGKPVQGKQNEKMSQRWDKPSTTRVMNEWIEEWIIGVDGIVTGGRIDQTWLQDFSNWLDPAAQAAVQKGNGDYYAEKEEEEYVVEIEEARKRLADFLKRLKGLKTNKVREVKDKLAQLEKLLGSRLSDSDSDFISSLIPEEKQALVNQLDVILASTWIDEKTSIVEEAIPNKAAQLLIRMGDDGINQLARRLDASLKGGQSDVAKIAVRWLGEALSEEDTYSYRFFEGTYTTGKVIESLTNALKNQDDDVRVAAAGALAQGVTAPLLQDMRSNLVRQVSDALRGVMENDHAPIVQQEAGVALLLLNHFDDRIVDQIIKNRELAVGVLARVIDKVEEMKVPALFWNSQAIFLDENGKVENSLKTQDAAVDMLRKFATQSNVDRKVAGLFAKAIEGRSHVLGLAAMQAIAIPSETRNPFSSDPDIRRALHGALTHPYPSMRAQSLQTLTFLGWADLKTTENMLRNDKNGAVKESAAAALIAINPYRAVTVIEDETLLLSAIASWGISYNSGDSDRLYYVNSKGLATPAIRQNAITALELWHRRKTQSPQEGE